MRRGVSQQGKRIGVSACRRVGVSAFAKHRQLVVNLLVIMAVPKSSLTSPYAHTPTRRPADTLPPNGRCQDSLGLRLTSAPKLPNGQVVRPYLFGPG